MTSPRLPVSFSPGPRRTGWLALFSVAVILGGATVTGAAYSGPAGEAYSPLNHFISELGELAQSRLAVVYDAGIVAGGLGLGIFLAVVAGHMTGRFRSAMRVAAVLAGASGVLTGLLPMDTKAAHQIVAAVFFMSGWSVAAVFSAWLLVARRPGFPRWLLVPGLGCIPIFAAFLAVFSTYRPAKPFAPILERPDIWAVPLLEWASLLSLLAWFTALGLVLVRRETWPDA
jgi:hypothetical membrane protein